MKTDSPAFDPQIQCGGKEALDGGRAKLVAQAMRRRGDNNVAAYRCTDCRKWHVGSSPKFLKKSERRG
jgi:hypothetical protein